MYMGTVNNGNKMACADICVDNIVYRDTVSNQDMACIDMCSV